MGNDEAFVSIAVAKRLLRGELSVRLLAFARAKKKSVARVVVELGMIEERRAARVARLARYRVARAADRIYAEVAVREGILDRAQARAGLAQQRELYAEGRGFIRLAALLRSEKKISRAEDRKLQTAVERFERAPKKVCVNAACEAILLASDACCPTCGAFAAARTRAVNVRRSGSRVA